jgi:hypothetical protein
MHLVHRKADDKWHLEHLGRSIFAFDTRDEAMDAGQTVKEAGSSGVDEVVSTAKDAAAQTKQEATDATQAVRSGQAPMA